MKLTRSETLSLSICWPKNSTMYFSKSVSAVSAKPYLIFLPVLSGWRLLQYQNLKITK